MAQKEQGNTGSAAAAESVNRKRMKSLFIGNSSVPNRTAFRGIGGSSYQKKK